MLRPGWTDAVLRSVLLVTTAAVLGACGAVGVGRGDPATDAATAVPSPELEVRYASLLARHQAGDAAALGELEAFSKDHPDLAGPLLTLGLARARAGDEARARAYLEQAGAVCSHCGPVWNQLGVLNRQQGRFADAEQAYRRAIELEPGYAPAYYNLAVLYELYIPRPDLALENYERFLQVGGESAEGQEVEKWVADLRRRVNATPKAARAEGRS
jgi:tetratricopeptide (TPR) repeat protein